MPSTEPQNAALSRSTHPFQDATGILVLIPDKVDIEEESRLYDELDEARFFYSIQLWCS